MSNTENKIALITGGNKGLGLEIARQLGVQGITVVIGSRDPGRGAAAAQTLISEGIDAHSVQLDVVNSEEIAALPAYFESKFGGLDILVNNAGVALEQGGSTVDNLRATYEANVLGPFAVTEALLPLLKASEAGRIVNHSSILGSLGFIRTSEEITADWILPGYSSSKAALNMLTVVLSRKLDGTNVKVNSAHPGWVKTDLGGEQAPLEVTDGAKTAVRLALLPADGPTGGFFHGDQELPW